MIVFYDKGTIELNKGDKVVFVSKEIDEVINGTITHIQCNGLILDERDEYFDLNDITWIEKEV